MGIIIMAMVKRNLPSMKEISEFVREIVDREEEVGKLSEIIVGIMKAQSPRISDISRAMPGNPNANYKRIERYINYYDVKERLLRLFDFDAEFIIMDVTEIPRKQSYNTEYVGRLSDGKTLGFWMLTLAYPYKGRAIPFFLTTYSERTIGDDESSRNFEHFRALREVKELIEDKVLVLDREFSYEMLFQALVEEGMKFVIRLNVGNKPSIFDREGNRISLSIRRGEVVILRDVLYKGRVRGNIIGEWGDGFAEPLWVFTNIEPQRALEIYRRRMKIEEAFRDLKSLMGLERVMNKKRGNLEKMIALLLLAYAIGLLIGEAIRDTIYVGEKI